MATKSNELGDGRPGGTPPDYNPPDTPSDTEGQSSPPTGSDNSEIEGMKDPFTSDPGRPSPPFEGLRIAYAFNVDAFYWSFPQLLIGGVDNRSQGSKLHRIWEDIKDNNNLPAHVSNIFKNEAIDNGSIDIQIESFRYYDIFLDNELLDVDQNTKNLQDSDESIADHCYIDFNFDEVNDNMIQDNSSRGNHGILVGDMGISVTGVDQSDYIVSDANVLEIKNVEK